MKDGSEFAEQNVTLLLGFYENTYPRKIPITDPGKNLSEDLLLTWITQLLVMDSSKNPGGNKILVGKNGA